MTGALLADPRGWKVAAVALGIALLPLVYVAEGHRYSPFAKDLRDRPDLYKQQDALLVLNRVSQCGRGWIEAGEPGGTVKLVASERFGLQKDEYVNLLVGWRDGRFEVLDVGRHRSRGGKWLVSYPVLVAVAVMLLVRVRWSREEGGLAVRGGCRIS